MKEVYLIRHGEKDPSGVLTDAGKRSAAAMRNALPPFAKVIASDSERARLTAQLLTSVEPVIDVRAGFYMATQEKSDAINTLANERNIPFLEAVSEFNDTEVLAGVASKARELDELINEMLNGLDEAEKGLIVSHDLSISPAMSLRGIPLESIDYLSGYIIREEGSPVPYPVK